MSELFKKVLESQEGNKRSMEELCIQFKPLLKKYSNMLGYEDAYSEMVVTFIEIVYKIPLNNSNFIREDKYILSYIKKCIHNAYILLNKRKELYISKTSYYDDSENSETFIDKYSYKSYNSRGENKLFLVELRDLLTEEEYNLFILKYMDSFTGVEIANIYGISKQAVSKKLKKLRDKLIKFYR